MKILREPLFQFLLLGGALFIVFGLIGKATSTEQITITSDKIEELVKGFRFDNKGKSPTPQEVDRLIEDYIREEVLCRQAWINGLAVQPPAVRRAVRENMEFTLANEATAMPDEAQLQAFLEKHPEMFRNADGSVPQLSSIRDTVLNAWEIARHKEARDAAYQQLRAQYTVVIHRPTTAPATQSTEAK